MCTGPGSLAVSGTSHSEETDPWVSLILVGRDMQANCIFCGNFRVFTGGSFAICPAAETGLAVSDGCTVSSSD